MTSPNPTWTLPDLEAHWRASRSARTLAPETYRNTIKVLGQLKPLASKRLEDWTRAELASIMDGLTPGNASVFLSRTRALLAYAARLDQITHDPTSKLTAPKGGHYRRWTKDETKIMASKAAPEVALAVKLAYYTGQRMSDVLKMRWDDVKGGSISIVQKKTGKPLVIPIHPALGRELRKAAKTAPERCPTIVANTQGEPYNIKSFRSRFRLERERLGLPDDMVFHGIRKMVASSLSEEGASSKMIQAVGGWSSTKMVDLYTMDASQPALAGKAMEMLEAI